MDYYKRIDKMIIKELDKGRDIAIVPFGKLGMLTKSILNMRYGKEEVAIFDNGLSKYNSQIKPIVDVKLLGENVTLINTAIGKEVFSQISEEVRDCNFSGDYVSVCASEERDIPGKDEFICEIKDILKTSRVVDVELSRFGSIHDGGYVMCSDVARADVAYSFGIASDVSWDDDIRKHNLDVYMYDPFIEHLPREDNLFHFFKQGISNKNEIVQGREFKTWNSLIRANAHENKKVILKMDVEGAEWDFLETISEKELKNIIQMTFEMHDFCNAENWDRILRIIRKIVKTHIPVWVHGNNNGCYMKCDKGIVPNLLEITFVNSDYYRVEDIRTSFPTPLDYVNIEGILEIELGEW